MYKEQLAMLMHASRSEVDALIEFTEAGRQYRVLKAQRQAMARILADGASDFDPSTTPQLFLALARVDHELAECKIIVDAILSTSTMDQDDDDEQ